jgi:tetratricopeptide (TPR) repeat protein
VSLEADSLETDLKEKDTKMNGPARFTALAVVLAGMVLSISGCNQLAARDQLNKGVEAYKSAHYEEAIGHFQKATQLDPTCPWRRAIWPPRWPRMWCPDGHAGQPEHRESGDRYLQGGSGQGSERCEQPEADRGHSISASRSWMMPRIGRRRFSPLIPKDPEAAYTIGVIDWTEAHENMLAALHPLASTTTARAIPRRPRR